MKANKRCVLTEWIGNTATTTFHSVLLVEVTHKIEASLVDYLSSEVGRRQTLLCCLYGHLPQETARLPEFLPPLFAPLVLEDLVFL